MTEVIKLNFKPIGMSPFRSCTWLYSLRFSSRTLWYPEAAWARPCRCLPIKGS